MFESFWYNVRMKKKLYRSTENRMLAGVLAGLAEHYHHDVVLWCLAFLFLLVLTGLMPGVLLYVIAWIVIPVKPLIEPVEKADYIVFE